MGIATLLATSTWVQGRTYAMSRELQGIAEIEDVRMPYFLNGFEVLLNDG